MKKHIIYVGGFRLPDGNGSAIRAIDISNLLGEIGYTTHVGGLINSDVKLSDKIFLWDYSILNGKKIPRDSNISPIISKIQQIGKNNLKAIIAYNYAPIAFYKLYSYCKTNDIKLIADITEWYLIDGKPSFLKYLRMLLTTWRIKYISPKCDAAFVAVSEMKSILGMNDNIIVLPQVSSISKSKNKYWPSYDIIKLVFVGYVGSYFTKEIMNVFIKTLHEIKNKVRPFKLSLIGLSKQEALIFDKSLKDIIQESSEWLNFHGKISNKEAKRELSKAHYSVFIRPNNRVSQFGFPGKVKEAFDAGIPILTNNTGDLNKYIQTKVNGFILEGFTLEEFIPQLTSILQMDEEDYRKIKVSCSNENPFYQQNFKLKLKDIFEKI